MIWVLTPMKTTAGWVRWSQEFRDQLCALSLIPHANPSTGRGGVGGTKDEGTTPTPA